MFHYLIKNWGVDEQFRGSYAEDYVTLTNAQTATRDHNSVSVFREDENWRGKPLERYERRPVPDLIAWQENGKLHYLPFKLHSNLPQGPWDKLPELFLPSRVLDLAFRLFRQPEPGLLNHVAFLAWVSSKDANNYFQENERLCASQFQNRPSPPRANPRAFDFLEKFCQFRRSNAPPVRASKSVKSPTLQAC